MTQQQQPQQQDEQMIEQRMSVPASAERAFAFFTGELAAWWPAAYTWSQDVLDTIAIEPRENGRCFERGPHKFECDWGRVLVWEPPHRLVFTWQISPRREPVPDPAKASEVEVQFTLQSPESAQMIFEHRGFARHGDGATEYRDMLASPQGWPYILGCYLKSIEGTD